MNELDGIVLEGKDFIIVDEITLAGIKYIHLASADDPEDFCIRKIKVENGKEMLTGLDSDEEFAFALDRFIKKNHKVDEN